MATCFSLIPLTPTSLVTHPTNIQNTSNSHPIPNVMQISYYEHNMYITVTKSAQEIDDWLYKRLSVCGFKNLMVGFDVEWLPNLLPGEDHPVATLQLCIGRHCIIIQLLHLDVMSVSLQRFLKNTNFCFVGVGVVDDAKKLFQHHGLIVGRLIDLNKLACLKYNNPGFLRIGLKRLAKVILKKDMEKPKEITLSNWDAETLSYRQIEYGAIDAFVSFQIAFVLNKMVNVPSLM